MSLRTTELTSLQKAVGFTKEQVDQFFDKLSHLIEEYSFSSSKIFNADETGVSCVYVNKLKILSVKRKTQVEKLTLGERCKNITDFLIINASGDYIIPLLFVVLRTRVDKD